MIVTAVGSPIRTEVAERMAALLAEQLGPDGHSPTCSDFRRWGWAGTQSPGCLSWCRDIRAVLIAAGRLVAG